MQVTSGAALRLDEDRKTVVASAQGDNFIGRNPERIHNGFRRRTAACEESMYMTPCCHQSARTTGSLIPRRG